jgi:sulfide dehydrogenase [flavocytochrome c] flavoprotein subunit
VNAVSRRHFLSLAGGAAGLPLITPLVRAAELMPLKGTRVVVVGGGFGGAIAAKTLRLSNPEIEVVLVERNRSYSALPGANWVIGGSRRIGENRLTYDRLEGIYGVRMLYGEAMAVDVAAKAVVLAAGTLPYDYAIVAPGIGFRFDDIEGYVASETPDLFPHAWMGGEEIVGLKKRLEEMKNGGLVVVSLPLPPYRCPQAAYERISQIAFYLKQAKPRSKIIVLDASQNIVSLANLFLSGWEKEYKNLIEYRGGQRVVKIDAPRSSLSTASEALRADVVNLIPPQTAGALAHASGLIGDDKRWCPVDHVAYESTKAAGVYIIGDACLGDNLQKSASAANAQGKACALNIAAVIARRKPQPHFYANTLFSLLDDKQGASSIDFHRGDGRVVARMDKGGGESSAWSEIEGTYARAWLGSLLAEMSS